MRLIDADKLILHLNDYALQEAPFKGESADTYNAIKQCIEAVEEQPTAYDVDKVVEQLKDVSYERFGYAGMGGENVVNLDDAIEIVKAGGENDE
jgi:hypothetical protein